MNTKENIETFNKLYESMYFGIRGSKTKDAKNWMKDKGLTANATDACYNSGRFHHSENKVLIEQLIQIGFLTRSNSNTKFTTYNCFAKKSICFPLKNNNNEIVNFYAIPLNGDEHLYLNDSGIYPHYPTVSTETLYLTNSVIGAATLIESRILGKEGAVMALREGELTPQHKEAINQLKNLKQIIIIK